MSFELNLVEWKELRTYLIYIFCGVFGGLVQVVALRHKKFKTALRAIIVGAFTALVIGLLTSVTDWPTEMRAALCLLGGFGGTLTICYVITLIIKKTGGDLQQLTNDAKTFYGALAEADNVNTDGKEILFKIYVEGRVTAEQYSQLIKNDKSCIVSLLEGKKITATEFEIINTTIF